MTTLQVATVFGFGNVEVNIIGVSEILLYGQWCWNQLEVNVIQINVLQNIINILCDSSTQFSACWVVPILSVCFLILISCFHILWGVSNYCE